MMDDKQRKILASGFRTQVLSLLQLILLVCEPAFGLGTPPSVTESRTALLVPIFSSLRRDAQGWDVCILSISAKSPRALDQRWYNALYLGPKGHPEIHGFTVVLSTTLRKERPLRLKLRCSCIALL